MIIDPSVVVAMLLGEPEAPIYANLLKDARVVRMSAASYVELAAVVDGRGDATASGALEPLLRRMQVVIEPFTERQAHLAREAYQRFGRGSGHAARLNMGDCFSYASARDLGEPLLFKGVDFTLTDIEIVIRPDGPMRLSEVVAQYGRSAVDRGSATTSASPSAPGPDVRVAVRSAT